MNNRLLIKADHNLRILYLYQLEING